MLSSKDPGSFSLDAKLDWAGGGAKGTMCEQPEMHWWCK